MILVGLFWGFYNKEKIVQEKKEEDKSVNRRDWAIWVLGKEEERIGNSINFVKLRVQVLLEEITQGDRGSLRHQNATDEVLQLARVIKAISGAPLMIKNEQNKIYSTDDVLQIARDIEAISEAPLMIKNEQNKISA